MKPLIVANWKMNPLTLKGAKLLFDSVTRGVNKIKRVEVVICPPFVYLPILNVHHLVMNTKLGAQDCFWEEKGPFTGEVSPKMLKDLGVEYVIVGHSERRALGETNEMINKKIRAALKKGLKPILCIGETKIERKENKTKKVLQKQLKGALNRLIISQSLADLIIAYEPVWAIGTGNSCQPLEAQKANLIIKKTIAQIFNVAFAQKIPILYGGSVNSKNAKDYIKAAQMRGFLVGGASLDAKEFIEILKEVKNLDFYLEKT